MDEKEWDLSSENYYEDVLSPIKNADNKELLDDIKKAASKKAKVLEAGCGIGELIPLLSKKYGEVKAIDFSKGMIEQAKTNNENVKNVEFKVADMKQLGETEKYEVAISINSLLSPSLKEISQMIKEIHKSLKPGGKFIGVLPSMESYLYQSMLEADKEIRRGTPAKKAMSNAASLIEGNKEETVLGITGFDGLKQKAFYEFEVRHRFKKAGFENIEIKKIRYNWEDWEEAGQRKHTEHEPPWDWHIKCEKPK